MNIQQNCILSLLEKYGFEPYHIDNHRIGTVSYYFKQPKEVLKFEKSCVPNRVVVFYLSLFSISHKIAEIETLDCECQW